MTQSKTKARVEKIKKIEKYVEGPKEQVLPAQIGRH